MRAPILITATTTAQAVILPEQYRNIEHPVAVGVIVEDGLSEWQYSNIETGNYVTVPNGDPIGLGYMAPGDGGVLFWVKAPTDTSIVIQTSLNVHR